MKKFLAAAVLVFSVLVPAAAQTGNVAVGPIYGINMLGLDSPLFGGWGLTGKIPGLVPIFGLNFFFSAKEQRSFIGGTADWILYRQPIYEPWNINFYMGPGVYASVLVADQSRADVGLRIPIGVNWVPLKFLEVFGELTPAVGVVFHDPVNMSWVFQSAVGARLWF
jgi:hypothetical protein